MGSIFSSTPQTFEIEALAIDAHRWHAAISRRGILTGMERHLTRQCSAMKTALSSFAFSPAGADVHRHL